MIRILFFKIILIVLLSGKMVVAQETLPAGSHPPALTFDHFPSQLYAVIWRNWNMVPVERIAKTVGATPKQVSGLAAAMGLPPARELRPDFEKKIYITVIRRNWHLLPYDQLLTLLNFTEKELEFALKEDDFLFIKLGSLKPRCERVVYKAPDAREKKRLTAIKAIAGKYFTGVARFDTQPFDFVARLQRTPEPPVVNPTAPDQLRYIYSYFGVFGDPLIDTLQDPYPEGLLSRLSEKGVTGVWMHVVLNQLAPGGESFPEFGEGHETRIANLRKITERARKYGISVYLYMNEPRTMPLSFFEKRKDMMGAVQGDFRAMCTAHPAVAQWMENALTYVFTAVPYLGGVFTITASENHTHCASHNNQKTCERCGKREYADIIADVNAIISRGVHAANANAKVIAWDWGWHGHGLASDIIERLPKDVWLMSVSEWAKEIERGGVYSKIGEYSISAPGPGSRSQQHWAWAKQAGLKTVAKVQFNNTWELSAVPWLPVSYLIAEHAANLAKTDINGLMLSWSLGGYPSPNLEIAKAFADNPSASIDEVLTDLATRKYGKKATPEVLKAWKQFSDSFREFPYHISTVYTAPQQYGPSNLLYAQPTGYKATMVGIPYDDLNSWRSIYPADVYIAQMKKVADGWKEGLESLKMASVPLLAFRDQEVLEVLMEEFYIAKAAWLHFASVANQASFVQLRDSLLSNPSGVAASKIKERLKELLEDEMSMAADLFEIVGKDSRIGFEASNQYYYVRQDLVEKILNCRQLMELFR
ncbi:MAG: hypothetical protein KIT80_13775 [Chitinophagaceae bacterium]|nr:hypothetical protein [Chitinophagaceae bacterium]MCW5927979.1 hypothetical protein [Chitinophagaceae bacterium]